MEARVVVAAAVTKVVAAAAVAKEAAAGLAAVVKVVAVLVREMEEDGLPPLTIPSFQVVNLHDQHTGAIAGHDHVTNVSVQLARNSSLRVRVNRKVATTAADNKQGDVQAMEFGIPGYDDLVRDVSLVCVRISSSIQHGLNGKLQLGDYLGDISS